MARRPSRPPRPAGPPTAGKAAAPSAARSRRDGNGEPAAPAEPSRTVSSPKERADAGAERASPASPTTEQIAVRAYEIFLARGGEHGRAEEDWLQAERELRSGDPLARPGSPAPEGRRAR